MGAEISGVSNAAGLRVVAGYPQRVYPQIWLRGIRMSVPAPQRVTGLPALITRTGKNMTRYHAVTDYDILICCSPNPRAAIPAGHLSMKAWVFSMHTVCHYSFSVCQSAQFVLMVPKDPYVDYMEISAGVKYKWIELQTNRTNTCIKTRDRVNGRCENLPGAGEREQGGAQCSRREYT